MLWDSEVDVVCTGSGVGGLASAIVAVDSGLDVFVARPRVDVLSGGPRPASGIHQWLGTSAADPDTAEYFAALSADLDPLVVGDAELPVRVVEEADAGEPVRGVEPFYGARLRDWAQRCLASPYGFVYTRVGGREMSTVRTRGGETVEVGFVGALDVDGGPDVGSALTGWLGAQAQARDIEVADGTSLQRIVFDEGDPVGAVFTTPDGPLAVRARHGVAVADGSRLPVATSVRCAGRGRVQVGLVRHRASRFGRLELLTTASVAEPARPACLTANRELPNRLREARRSRSADRRCRKTRWYPSPGQ